MTRSIPTRIASVAAALGIALAGGALAASSGAFDHDTAAAASSRTLTYTASILPSEAGGADAAPTGMSVGDTLVNVATLTHSGKPAGVAHLVETIVDKAHQGTSQSINLFVSGGSIETMGGGVNLPIAGAPQPPGDVRAVVGGTGAYAGVSGTLTISPVNGTTSRFVVRLR